MSALGQEVVARIKRLMETRGLKQSELADAATIPRPNMSNYFRGLHIPGLDAIERIAKALGVPAYVFFSDLEKDEQIDDILKMHERRAVAAIDQANRMADLNEKYSQVNRLLMSDLERAQISLSQEEMRLIDLFRGAAPPGRKAILAAAEAVTSGKKDKARSRRVSKA